MGRPINKKYFLKGGIVPSDSSFSASNGGPWVGLSMAVSSPGAHYAQGTTIVIGQGQLGAESVTATANLTINSSTGAITGITVTNPGSGYNDPPSYTLVQPPTVTSTVNSGIGGQNTFTVATVTGIEVGMLIAGASTGFNGHVQSVNGTVITSTVNNNGTWTNATNLTFSSTGTGAAISFDQAVPTDTGNIAAIAFIDGDSQATAAEIIKQEASKRYLVETRAGVGQCKLVTTSTVAVGQMTIIATDVNGSTYFVEKLTAHKAYLVQYTKNGSFAFANNAAAGWTLSSASTGIVSIASY
jgi:hypothetical protein